MGLSGAGSAPGEPGEGEQVMAPGGGGSALGAPMQSGAGRWHWVFHPGDFGSCRCNPAWRRAQGPVPHHAGMALPGAPWPWHRLGFSSPVLHPLLEELPNPLAGSICSVPVGDVGSPASGTWDGASPPRGGCGGPVPARSQLYGPAGEEDALR